MIGLFSLWGKKEKIAETNKEKLGKAPLGINFPHDAIPEEFLSRFTYEIMDDPIFCDKVETNPEFDSVIDQIELKQYWKNLPPRADVDTDEPVKIINPFTNGEFREDPIVDTKLKQKIDAFVKQQLAIAAQIKKVEKAIAPFNSSYTNRVRFKALGLSSNLLPTEFVDHRFQTPMTYPVKIDSNNIVDYNELLKWWNKDPKNNYYKNPFTMQPINTIIFAISLHEKINHFLDEKLSEYLDTIKRKVDEYELIQPKTCYERLLNTKISEKDIPEKFIAHNFTIITHPVKLDNEYIVDYHELITWWKDPENKYKNFFTGEKIVSMEYDLDLKEEIEYFVQTKSSTLLKQFSIMKNSKLGSFSSSINQLAFERTFMPGPKS